MNALEILKQLERCGAERVLEDRLISVLLSEPFVYVVPDSNRERRFARTGVWSPSYCFVPRECERRIDADKTETAFIRQIGYTIVDIRGPVVEVYCEGNSLRALTKLHGVEGPSYRTVKPTHVRVAPDGFDAYAASLVTASSSDF